MSYRFWGERHILLLVLVMLFLHPAGCGEGRLGPDPGGIDPVLEDLDPSAAPAGAAVSAFGREFGDTLEDNSLWFGDVPATITAVIKGGPGERDEIRAVVPEDLEAGFVSVFVQVDGRKSNGLLFEVTAGRTFPAGDEPHSLVAGDLNRDHFPDLIVANRGGTVSILMNNRDGTFQDPVSYAAGERPAVITIGDLDGDLDPDLAVADRWGNPSEGFVRILMNNGDGTFQDPVSYAAGESPGSVALGDLDGDLDPDLVVTDRLEDPLEGFVRILVNNGDGTFQDPVSYAVGKQPMSVAIGNLDANLSPDLVVTDFGPMHGPGSVWLLMNNGDGTFAEPFDHDAGDRPYKVAIDDLDGDLDLDLAVTDFAYDFSGGSVLLLMNNGDGTFQENDFDDRVNSGTAIAVGDLNGDHESDLIVANDVSSDFGPSDCLMVFLNKGQGAFSMPVSYAAGKRHDAVVVADLNADGHMDLAASAFNNVVVLLGNGDGTFPSPSMFYLSEEVRSTVMGDLDGDGDSDLAVLAEPLDPYLNNWIGSFSVLMNNGEGIFQLTERNVFIGDSKSLASGDFDGDLAPDLALLHPGFTGKVGVSMNNGSGDFGHLAKFSVGWFPRLRLLCVGDFNKDAYPDLAVMNRTSSPHRGDLAVLFNDGDGTFEVGGERQRTQGSPESMATGDINGDGYLDLVTVNTETKNVVSLFFNNRDGTFRAPIYYITDSHWEPTSVAIADFNGDLNPDLAVSDRGPAGALGAVHVLLNNGDGTFPEPVSYGPLETAVFVTAEDMDRDGCLDLIVACKFEGTIHLLPGNGDGTFQDSLSFASGGFPVGVNVGDVDGDNDPDLVITGEGGRLSVLRF